MFVLVNIHTTIQCTDAYYSTCPSPPSAPWLPTCLSIISNCLSTLPQGRVSPAEHTWCQTGMMRPFRQVTSAVDGDLNWMVACKWTFLKFNVSLSTERSYSHIPSRWGVFLRGSTRWRWCISSLKGFPNTNTWACGWIRNSHLILYLHTCWQARYLYRNRATVLLFCRKRTTEAVILSDVIYRQASVSTLTPLDWGYHSTLRFITGHCYSTHHCILHENVGWAPLTIRLDSWCFFF